MVRGPMIARRHRGVLEHERHRHVGQGHPGLVGQLLELLRRSRACAGSPAATSRTARAAAGRRPTRAWRPPLAVAPRQPAARQRAPRDARPCRTSGTSAARALDPADEDRVRRLLVTGRSRPPPLGHPLRLHDLRGQVGRRADVADLALVDQVGQGRQGVVDVGRRAGAGAAGRGRCSRCPAGAGCPRPRGSPSGVSCPAGWGRVAHRAVHLGGQRRRRRGGPCRALPTISSDSPRE